ncbi:RagB/SusD family nutrient uptake outer membrane protein [Niabella soli]|uniref:Carbohydrate-binding protein SusD n=1 Tax=Niabella soli DSM 19437 TaxID=929713 RepID=W0EZD1_9BACT|nr:RagB/SusD family nutrient uptake outer membrane protein [Niabella soli]AHF14554.1 carbohydrate-binding protein SusD [Niabella soli DSM 19437]
MKKINIYILIALAVFSLCGSSCSKFLEEQPQSFTNSGSFYQTKAEALAGVNACYIKLYNVFNENLMAATEFTTDLTYLDNGGVDMTFGISPSNPGVGDDIWTAAYNGIMICNATIAGIQRSPLADSTKPALIGEAATMRALYYYVLTSMFGDVPYYTSDASANFDGLIQVAQMGRMPAAATRDSLIADLKKWAPAMPQTRSSSIANNRVGAATAYMLIGKMALWNKEWDECIAAMQQLKNIYGALSQYSLTDTWFRNKNKAESIFEVQYTYAATGIAKVSHVACQLTPTRATGKDVYDGVSIPELGTTATVYTSATPTKYFMSLYDTTDPRRNMILAYTYNSTWFNRPKSGNYTGKPWMGPKFWCPNMATANDGNNQKVFRYADALLMLAEASNEKGDAVTAMAALNEVKARAKASFVLTSYPGKDAFLEEVKKERARELTGEYMRRWDLARWGTFFTAVETTAAAELAVIKTNLRPYHEFYPIPQAEVDRSKGVLTNDAYNKQ